MGCLTPHLVKQRPKAQMKNNTQKGMVFMVMTMLCFAMQDGLSRHLAANYNVITTVAIRYAFFVIFVLAYGCLVTKSLRQMLCTQQLPLQIIRGVILALMSCLAIMSTVRNGLVNFHSIFAIYPLIILVLSAPILSEFVGWRRWMAVIVGFCGVLIVLRPSGETVNAGSVLAITAALLMAVYGICTRLASKRDNAETSLFWAAAVGGVVMLLAAPFIWKPPTGSDWIWMAFLCVIGACGHYLLIKTLDIAKASSVQPFAYLQLVFGSIIGVVFFDDKFDTFTLTGCVLIVGAGLFSMTFGMKTESKLRE